MNHTDRQEFTKVIAACDLITDLAMPPIVIDEGTVGPFFASFNNLKSLELNTCSSYNPRIPMWKLSSLTACENILEIFNSQVILSTIYHSNT